MAIDTTRFTSGDKTANGGIRNARQFWKEWAGTYRDSLSKENLTQIELGRSPRVDATWTKAFPEHQAFTGETLIHHHLDKGPQAVPIPFSVHALQPGWGIWHD
jgi:hypothetical protein